MESNINYYGNNYILSLKNLGHHDDNHSLQKEIAFCQDISGSMSCGVNTSNILTSKLELCKASQLFVVKNLVGHKFGLVVFDHQVTDLINLDTINDVSNINSIIKSIDTGGSTNLNEGILSSLELFKDSSNETIKYLFVFTDGIPNYGETSSSKIISNIVDKLKKLPTGIKIIFLGYGDDCDRNLLHLCANETGGCFYYIDSGDKIAEIIGEELGDAFRVRQQNIKISYDPTEIYFKNNNLGDLLLNEEKHIEFRVLSNNTNPSIILSFTECSSGLEISRKIDISKKILNPHLVAEKIFTNKITDILDNISNLSQKEQRDDITSIILEIKDQDMEFSNNFNLLVSKLSDIVNQKSFDNRLIRNMSVNIKRQRGGIFSSQFTKQMRSHSSCFVDELLKTQSDSIKTLKSKSLPILGLKRQDSLHFIIN